MEERQCRSKDGVGLIYFTLYYLQFYRIFCCEQSVTRGSVSTDHARPCILHQPDHRRLPPM
jgi:hypothetical protein